MCCTIVWVGGPGRALFAARLRAALGQEEEPPPFGRLASEGGGEGLASALRQQHCAENSSNEFGFITEPVDLVCVGPELSALRDIVVEYLWRPADLVVWVGSTDPVGVPEGASLMIADCLSDMEATVDFLRLGGVFAAPPSCF